MTIACNSTLTAGYQMVSCLQPQVCRLASSCARCRRWGSGSPRWTTDRGLWQSTLWCPTSVAPSSTTSQTNSPTVETSTLYVNQVTNFSAPSFVTSIVTILAKRRMNQICEFILLTSLVVFSISDRKQNARSLLTPLCLVQIFMLYRVVASVLLSMVAFSTIFLLVEVIQQPIRIVEIGGC